MKQAAEKVKKTTSFEESVLAARVVTQTAEVQDLRMGDRLEGKRMVANGMVVSVEDVVLCVDAHADKLGVARAFAQGAFGIIVQVWSAIWRRINALLQIISNNLINSVAGYVSMDLVPQPKRVSLVYNIL